MSLYLTDTLRLLCNWGHFLDEDSEPRLVNTQTFAVSALPVPHIVRYRRSICDDVGLCKHLFIKQNKLQTDPPQS